MTRQGPRKKVAAGHWEGRLTAGRDFRAAARDAVALADAGSNLNPAISLMVLAAIAYADTLTARRAQVVNQQDHAAGVALLRDVLRSALPDAQERRYRRLLAEKDPAQYGSRRASLDEALRLMGELDEFAVWVESQI